MSTTSTLSLRAVPVIDLHGSDAEPAHFAREELRRYLGMILADATSGTDASPCRAILLRVAPGQFESDEAYAWRVKGEAIEIDAGGDLGLVFGVYAFLRDVCGCIFAAPGPSGELVPKCSPLVMRVMPVRRAPVIWYRAIQCYYFEPPEHYQRQIDWLTKNGYNYVQYHLAAAEDGKVLREQIDPQTGQSVFPLATGPSAFDETYFDKYILPVVRQRGLKLDFNHHNLWYWIPPHVHKQTHPEWFSLVNGERGKNLNQLCICTSNPQVVDELVRRVKVFLRTHPNVRMVGVIPEDGLGMCQCEKCLAGDVDRADAFAGQRDHRTAEGENRSLINRNARLLNTVARAVRDEFPDVLIGGCAYVDLTMPPRDIIMESNLVIQVAVYWRDGARPLASQNTSILNKFFYDVLKQWRRVMPGGRLLLYEYYMGMMAQKCLPYPMTEIIAEDWRALRAIGVEGASTQTCAGATLSYTLNLAAFGRCAWDQTVDAKVMVADYARALYGPAAPALSWIFDRWHQAMADFRPLPPSSSEPGNAGRPWRSEPVLRPDGSSVVFLWNALGGDARVTQAVADARRLADSPQNHHNVEAMAAYLEYCRLAAAALAASVRGRELVASDARAAGELMRDAVERRYPDVIEYLNKYSMPGWVLPRIRPRWESDRNALVKELAALEASESSGVTTAT